MTATLLGLLAASALLLADGLAGRRPSTAARRGAGSARRTRGVAMAAAAIGLFGLIARPSLPWRAAPPSAAGAFRLETPPGASGTSLRLGAASEARQSGGQAVAPANLAVLPRPIESEDAAGLARRWAQRGAAPEFAVVVEGWGLEEPAWRDLPAARVVGFAPAPLPVGFSEVIWRRAVEPGAPAVIEGRVVLGPGPRAAQAAPRVVARDAAGAEAARAALEPLAHGSAEDGAIEATWERRFRLDVTPPGTGPALYRLEALEGEAVVAAEAVDLEIEAPRPLRILWLESAPGAESAAVRRWLLDAPALRGVFALRTRIARERVRTLVWRAGSPGAPEGPSPGAIEGLLEEAVAGFDLVVADPGAVDPRDRDRLLAAVHDRGVGLLWLPRRGAPGAASGRLPEGLAWAPVEGVEGDWRVRPWRSGGLGEPLEIDGFTLRRSPGLDGGSGAAEWAELQVDATGRWLAASRPRGAGVEAVSALAGTHRWPLRGAADDFAAWWSALVEAVARPPATARLAITEGPRRVGRGTTISLRFPGADDAVGSEGPSGAPCALRIEAPSGAEVAIPWAENVLEPRLLHAPFWPSESGWHRAVCAAAALPAAPGTPDVAPATLRFWVAPREAWPAWAAARRMEATWARVGVASPAGLASAGDARATGEVEHPAANGPRRPIPPPLFYSVFVGGIVAVWAIERWRRD